MFSRSRTFFRLSKRELLNFTRSSRVNRSKEAGDKIKNPNTNGALIILSAFTITSVGFICLEFDSLKKNIFKMFLFNNNDRVVLAFEEGNRSKKVIDKVHIIIPRDDISNLLKQVFEPYTDYHSYHIVYGERGSGKSVAVQSFLTQLFPKNVVYFDASSCGSKPQETITELLQQLNVRPDMMISLDKLLIAAGEKYLKKHNKPMVLVIDSADLIALHQPDLLNQLLSLAKMASQRGVLKIVFITNSLTGFNTKVNHGAAEEAINLTELPEIVTKML